MSSESRQPPRRPTDRRDRCDGLRGKFRITCVAAVGGMAHRQGLQNGLFAFQKAVGTQVVRRLIRFERALLHSENTGGKFLKLVSPLLRLPLSVFREFSVQVVVFLHESLVECLRLQHQLLQLKYSGICGDPFVKVPQSFHNIYKPSKSCEAGGKIGSVHGGQPDQIADSEQARFSLPDPMSRRPFRAHWAVARIRATHPKPPIESGFDDPSHP